MERLEGRPAIVIANAGEVNAGLFDPIEAMADLAESHGAWLHVDGAFGLFARVSERSARLAAGAERASSVSADGHKWLNVPHDCGFAFVRESEWRLASYAERAAYLPSPDDPEPNLAYRAPEGSRRARAFAVWATLRACRAGYQAMVERHLDLAQRLGARIDAEPEFERLAAVQLNIVCFRWRPAGVPVERLDELNRALGAALLRDGRVFSGLTVFEGKVAFRPAIVNWSTRERTWTRWWRPWASWHRGPGLRERRRASARRQPRAATRVILILPRVADDLGGIDLVGLAVDG